MTLRILFKMATSMERLSTRMSARPSVRTKAGAWCDAALETWKLVCDIDEDLHEARDLMRTSFKAPRVVMKIGFADE